MIFPQEIDNMLFMNKQRELRCYIEEELYQKLKIIADKQKRSVTKQVEFYAEQMVDRYLSEIETQKGEPATKKTAQSL